MSLITLVIVIGQCLVEGGVFALKKGERGLEEIPQGRAEGEDWVIPPNIKMKGKATTSIFEIICLLLLLLLLLLSQQVRIRVVAWLVGDH